MHHPPWPLPDLAAQAILDSPDLVVEALIGPVVALVELEHAVHARDALVEGDPCSSATTARMSSVEPSSEVPIACIR